MKRRALRNVKIGSRTLKLNGVWQFLKKLNIELPYDPAIPLLGVHPRELKTYVYTKLVHECS